MPNPTERDAGCTLSIDDTITYLRRRAETSVDARLNPSEAAELVRYIDQLRAINSTFAVELMAQSGIVG